MSKILDGRLVRDFFTTELREKISVLKDKPNLVIIQVGDREESNSYIKQKKLFAEKIGAHVSHVKFSNDSSEESICEKIGELNIDKSVHGIIVQLPLPDNLDKNIIIQSIDPVKDVDGLTSINTKLLWSNEKGHVPATARGIITLLDYYQIPIKGKKVVVVGRSDLVGKPVAMSFLNRDATVTICHQSTSNIVSETKVADILVVAAGDPQFIKRDFVKEGQVILDVGISVVAGKKLVGDVDFGEVNGVVEAISPVPGGVGPMTVVSLFQNLLDAYMIVSDR